MDREGRFRPRQGDSPTPYGRALYDDGEIDEACRRFEQSLTLARTVGTLLNLARCHAAQGKAATAYDEYLDAASAADAEGQADRAEAARKLAAELEGQRSTLRLQPPSPIPDGLVVTQQGEPVDPLGQPHPIDPGEYRIEATAVGHHPWSKTVEVGTGADAVTVAVGPLEPKPEPETAPSAAPTTPTGDTASEGLTGMEIGGLAVGATGVALAIAGGVLGGLTLSKVSDARNDEALCGRGDDLCTKEGIDQIGSAEALGIGSTVLLGAGLAAVAAGTTMFLLGGDSAGDDVAIVASPFGVFVTGAL